MTGPSASQTAGWARKRATMAAAALLAVMCGAMGARTDAAAAYAGSSPTATLPPITGQSFDGARITSIVPVTARVPGETGMQLTISTPAFTGPTTVQVFLPPGYAASPKKRWPVTYYLHGAEGDATRFNAWYGDQITNYPSIVVAPDGGHVGFYSDWYNAGAFGPPEYETYDIDQLIPLIDGTFRTIASRQGRVLFGESMGGYGVGSYALLYPDLFAGAVSMSGFLDNNYGLAQAILNIVPTTAGGQLGDIYGSRDTQLVRWYGHNPSDLTGNLGNLELRVTTADGDPNPAEGSPLDPGEEGDCVVERAIYQTNLDFQQALKSEGGSDQFVNYGSGCHTLWNFRRQFAAALPFLRDVIAHPPPDPSTFSYRTIRPDFTIWGWQMATDPKRALEFQDIRNAGRQGLTLTGSGTTMVTTPPWFAHAGSVTVAGADPGAGATQTIAPDRSGRITFSVDLGAPHPNQQYTTAADAAGENGAAYFTTRTVTFTPHPRARRHRKAKPHRRHRVR